jgi:cobalt-zinc-cadmium efflux system outer membrane protein
MKEQIVVPRTAAIQTPHGAQRSAESTPAWRSMWMENRIRVDGSWPRSSRLIERMRIATTVSLAALCAARVCAGESVQPLTVERAVELALEANTRVRGAEARWHAAEHQILPNYVPADPTVTYGNIDSPTNGFTRPADLSVSVSQPLQFPGKGYLQGTTVKRAAEIARLTYDAAKRDVRAETETAFYQLLLDQALHGVGAENVTTLKQVLHVTQVGYSTSRVTQLDFISAEFNLAAAEQQHQLEVSIATDRANLNQVLQRNPEEPLEIEGRLDLTPFRPRIEELTEAARRARQEILEAALTAENADTALTLAKLEYAPDFTLGYTYDHFQFPAASPDNVHLANHSLSIGMTLPVFFWFRQREDVESACSSLEAATSDLRATELQTSTQANLYRQADLAYRTAILYRDSLTPLARQAVSVALVAPHGGKIDFVVLANERPQRNSSQVTYLQQANQFLAERIALEQTIGQPVPQ